MGRYHGAHGDRAEISTTARLAQPNPAGLEARDPLQLHSGMGKEQAGCTNCLCFGLKNKGEKIICIIQAEVAEMASRDSCASATKYRTGHTV